MKKRILAALLSICVMGTSLLCPAAVRAQEKAAAQTQTGELGASAYADLKAVTGNFAGLDAQYHSQEQIREYYRSHPVTGMEAQYITKPSVTAPYALGELTEATKQDALNMLNLYRYIAGVPEVGITSEAQSYAQAAALACAANRKLSHTPDCPAGMEKELYSLAVYGAFNSNIAALGNQISNTIRGYMLESNGDADFGHRRQLLDYYYEGAGFGMAESVSGGYYSATFVGASLREDKVISYPGQNQPLEYFGPGYAWTVIIPEKVDRSSINIKLTDTRTGQEWNFNESTSSNFRLDIESKSTCAIFSPSNINYRDGDNYRVEITGIEKPIAYEVNLFQLSDAVPVSSIKFNMAGCSPFEGEENYIARILFTPENASNKIVTWSSSDPGIAEAVWAGNGVCKIIAKKAGTAVITATSEDGGHTATMKVEVKPRATGVTLDKTDVTIGVGQSFEIAGKASPQESGDTVMYKSDYDKSIIQTERGRFLNNLKVTGKAVGETQIHAYLYSNRDIQVTCKVKVVAPVYTKKLQLNITEKELEKGESIQLDPTFTPSNVTCRELEWTTSNRYIASVSESGKVAADGDSVGKAVITAKALDGSGQTAACTVLVYGQYEKPSAPVVISCTSDQVVLRKVTGCEYSMDKKKWQDSNEFTDLEPEHSYTFYARKKASGYYKASEASEGTTAKTTADKCKHKNTVFKNESQATCTEAGYTGDTYCNDCKKTIATGKTVKALGHDYAADKKSGNQVCTRCGAVKGNSKEPEKETSTAAATAGSDKLKESQTYKYDLDGDGNKESVKIKAGKAKDDRYYAAYVYVNGEKKLTLKEKWGFYNIEAELITMSKKKVFLYIHPSGDNGDGQTAIYQYKNGKLKQSIDFGNMGRYASVAGVTKTKIKMECGYTSSAVGYFSYACNLVYKSGKLTPEKKIYAVSTYSPTEKSKKPYLTAKGKIQLYKSNNTKQKSFVLKKGQKVKVVKYYSKGKTDMFQVKTSSGKIGWLTAPREGEALFQEAYGVA